MNKSTKEIELKYVEDERFHSIKYFNIKNKGKFQIIGWTKKVKYPRRFGENHIRGPYAAMVRLPYTPTDTGNMEDMEIGDWLSIDKALYQVSSDNYWDEVELVLQYGL